MPTRAPRPTSGSPGRHDITRSMKPSVSATADWLRAETNAATAMVKKPSMATTPPVA